MISSQNVCPCEEGIGSHLSHAHVYSKTVFGCCNCSSSPHWPGDPLLTWFQCNRWGTKLNSPCSVQFSSVEATEASAVWVSQIRWFQSLESKIPSFLFLRCSSATTPTRKTQTKKILQRLWRGNFPANMERRNNYSNHKLSHCANKIGLR